MKKQLNLFKMRKLSFGRAPARARGGSMGGIKNTAKAVLSGAAVGIANGLFGGGGGMIAVPLLSGAMNFEEKAAHATAILIIAPVSLAGAAAYIISGYALPYIIIPAAVGMTAGGALGAQLLNKLPLMAVKVIFVAVMLAAGIRMILP